MVLVMGCRKEERSVGRKIINKGVDVNVMDEFSNSLKIFSL